MNQPPPGPYGGGGYGQRPPGPGGGPYGPPPGPYGAPGSPGPPGPYGAWPPPPLPPPRRGLGAGAITAIVLGGVAVLAVVLGGIGLLVNAVQGPEGTMKLTTPPTLDNGRYHRIPATPQIEQQERQLQEELPSDGKARIGTYSTDRSGDPLAGGLVLSGAHGDIDVSSSDMRDDMLDGVQENESGQRVGERRKFTPQGADGPEISCQLEKTNQGGMTIYAPACAWADESTAAVLLEVKVGNSSASKVDLAAFAATTARIKDEATIAK